MRRSIVDSRIFKYLSLSILVALSVAGCANQPRPLPLDPSGRVSLSGVSIQPPQEPNWQTIVMSTYQLSLGKRGPRRNETYIANAQLYSLPAFASEQEFKKAVSAGRLAEPDTGRFRLLTNEENLVSRKDTWCVEYHTIAEDRAAKTPDGAATMVRDEYGYHCQHPRKRSVGVFYSYSLRHAPGDVDVDLQRKAKDFLENVNFVDF
jgi:hypothetical protein